MTKLTIVVGMAGSGKTSLCEEIAKSRNIPASCVFPDATNLDVNDHSQRAGYRRLPEIIARLLHHSQDCVIDEPHLTFPEFRSLFKDFCDNFITSIDQQWIFFKKDVLACINNVYDDAMARNRRDISRFKALLDQIVAYEIPAKRSQWPGFELMEVYQPPQPGFMNEADAIAWLRREIEKPRQ